MLLATLSSFVMALVFGMTKGRVVEKFSGWFTLLPLSLFVYFIVQTMSVVANGPLRFDFPWVPSFGVNLSFFIDGLALLFLLLITGIGTLVFAYTHGYMHGDKKLHRFYAYLTVFMGAMIGLVSSDNLITLFIFWELTSISSFLLIGYKNNDAASRKSAITALAVTGLGGLFLLGFAIFAGLTFDTLSIQDILSSELALSTWTPLILMLLLFAASFTKSAQFPFHFWLPGAMKAPTPVSTYLHSATMVKAGIYLLLRFNPYFENHEFWHWTLLAFGGVTMLYAAFQTLFHVDMKSILAYSTISALGIIVFLIGVGGDYALTAAIAFVLAHALYKATLFMVTGIVDHQTGTRDITALGGLGKVMPIIMGIGILAALSNAGMPPFFGFIAKDLVYEGTLHQGSGELALTALAILTNVLLIYAGFAVGLKPFIGKTHTAFSDVKAPKFSLWWPPAITAFLGLLFGVAPFFADGLASAAAATSGAGKVLHLKLWHGFNTVLVLSITTLVLGIALFLFWKPNVKTISQIESLYAFSPKGVFEKIYGLFGQFALRFTQISQSGYLRNYVLMVVLALIIAMSVHVFNRPGDYWDNIVFTSLTVNEIALSLILVGSALFTVFSKSRLAAIAGLGVLGYAVCFVFVFYSAPDLALTQFSIDTLTVILFVLVLYNLPPYLRLSEPKRRYRDLGIAGVFGVLMTLVTLEAYVESTQRRSNLAFYFNENAYTLAKGKNIVNVILVDFRGADTLIETAVLAISAIGVFGLIKLRMKEDSKTSVS